MIGGTGAKSESDRASAAGSGRYRGPHGPRARVEARPGRGDRNWRRPGCESESAPPSGSPVQAPPRRVEGLRPGWGPAWTRPGETGAGPVPSHPTFSRELRAGPDPPRWSKGGRHPEGPSELNRLWDVRRFRVQDRL